MAQGAEHCQWLHSMKHTGIIGGRLNICKDCALLFCACGKLNLLDFTCFKWLYLGILAALRSELMKTPWKGSFLMYHTCWLRARDLSTYTGFCAGSPDAAFCKMCFELLS